MKKTDLRENETAIKKDADVPVQPVGEQANRYNITLPRSFSVYNDEGGILYRGEVERVASEMRAELFGEEKAPKNTQVSVPESELKKVAKTSEKKSVGGKRAFFFVLSMLISLALLAAVVIGMFSLESTEKYLSLYNYKIVKPLYISALDPVFSFLNGKFSLGLTEVPTIFGKCFTASSDTASMIAYYALPISIVVYVLFALIMLISSIIGLASKRAADGSYKKVRLGFLSVVMFLCALLAAVCGMIITGGTIKELLAFISGSAKFSAGYGLYAMAVAPILTFICTLFTYKKNKRA